MDEILGSNGRGPRDEVFGKGFSIQCIGIESDNYLALMKTTSYGSTTYKFHCLFHSFTENQHFGTTGTDPGNFVPMTNGTCA